MKIVVVGAAGSMGRKAVETIATFDEVSEIVALDRDAARLQAVAQSAPDKVRPVHFDAEHDSLAEHLAGARVALSTLGPFTKFGLTVLAAAIQSKVDYVDINDDWEPTLEALELNEAARRAGITALIGMGASPGISNVLAAKAAEMLDEVSELYTGWVVAGTESDAEGARPAAAMLHLVHEATGMIQVVEGGKPRLVRPLQRIDLRYPNVGDIQVCTVGHPEAVTLPRRFPGLTTCVNVMVGPAWWFDSLTEVMHQVDEGRLTAREGALRIEDGFVRPSDTPKSPRTPTIWALASGKLDGAKTRVAAGLKRWPEGKMAGATAIPASIALRLIIQEKITATGVVTAEEAVPFEPFMQMLEPLYTLPERENELYELVVEQGE